MLHQESGEIDDVGDLEKVLDWFTSTNKGEYR
jgi:hypothetical protein